MTSTNSNTIIGQNIRLFREEMGLTQDALGKFLGIPREQISYYESGSRSIPVEQLNRIANLFCVEEYDFYEEDSSKRRLNIAFAFRADQINPTDLQTISQFKKIVRNYLNMKKVAVNG